jgi:hypothetical protein
MQEKRVTRRKSGSRSSGSSTAVDRLTSNSSSPINMNFSMDTNAPLLPIHPPSAKLATHGRQGSDLSVIGHTDERKERNKGDWLNERPASPPHRENRRMSGFGFGTMPSNEKTSPIVVSNESDYFSIKSYQGGRISPSSSITTDSHKRSPSAFSTQANSSSLLPPPRVQSPVQKIYNSTSPSSSRPSSPNPQPSRRSPSPQLIVQNLPSVNSLNSSPKEPISSQGLTAPPLPPPNVPLPLLLNIFSSISSSLTLININNTTAYS